MRYPITLLALAIATLAVTETASAQVTVRSFHSAGLTTAPRVAISPTAPSVFVRPAPTPAPVRPSPTPAPGLVTCAVSENGMPASATISLRSTAGATLAGSCGAPLSAPAGIYTATVTLETALDRPTSTQRVVVPADGRAEVRATFQTSVLEVRFSAQGRATHGIAVIERDGRVVGTLGSGVVARVSAGTYRVIARHRTDEQVFHVSLAEGQRRALLARF